MENLEEIVQLLTRILDRFKDAYSRPDREIDLYDKYQALRQRHRVRIIGRFLVIDGGLARGKTEARLQRSMHLKTKETPQPKGTAPRREIIKKEYLETWYGPEQTTV